MAEELFSINMNIVIVMFPFRSADLLFTCGQRTCYSRAVSGFAHENVKKTWLGDFTVICVLYSDLTVQFPLLCWNIMAQ